MSCNLGLPDPLTFINSKAGQGPVSSPKGNCICWRMKPFTTALSFLILAAALGFWAQIVHATETEEVLKAMEGLEPRVFSRGFATAADCCYSYASRIRCSRFIYYFPTSGGCIKPGIIFITYKRKQVCADPSDQEVQKCIASLEPEP
ncbi:C-C motif chemokine 9-like isoform X1 [Psammomys obesus]|uniref:C-C motif chemokine 9-like isoform X1 n=1 Tax=Psammomys obesus TaxID=48139 RepID=UPI002452D86A|nr:C-C motif chemokine 9-like isoform X1 [Psammomys obesus]